MTDRFEHFPGGEPPDGPKKDGGAEAKARRETPESILRTTQARALISQAEQLSFASVPHFGNIMRSVDAASYAETPEKAELRKMYPEVLGDEQFTMTTWHRPEIEPPGTTKDFLRVFGKHIRM
jgi:hypothetical protein